MNLMQLVVDVIVVGLICWIVWWLVDFCGLPDPFAKVAKVLVALAAVVYLIGVLSGKAPAVFKISAQPASTRSSDMFVLAKPSVACTSPAVCFTLGFSAAARRN